MAVLVSRRHSLRLLPADCLSDRQLSAATSTRQRPAEAASEQVRSNIKLNEMCFPSRNFKTYVADLHGAAGRWGIARWTPQDAIVRAGECAPVHLPLKAVPELRLNGAFQLGIRIPFDDLTPTTKVLWTANRRIKPRGPDHGNEHAPHAQAC